MRYLPLNKGWKLKCGVLLALCVSNAYAEDDGSDRIGQLQKMLQDQQKQMQEQQWQMKAMAEELKALQGARGKAEGQPVFASFKDGIKLGDGSGDWQLAINGRVQADARAFSPSETAADTFSVRRARLGATMTFYKDFSARIEGEYSGTSTAMTYGYLDINKFKQAQIRIGQFKPFYGLERSMSTNFTDFQERSMADALVGSTYDRGVMVHGTPVKGMYYSAAWINGNNADETDVKYDNKDVMARLTGNIAEFAGWKGAVAHIGGFYAYGKQEPGSAIPIMQTEARGYKFFETADTTANKFASSVDRTRGGVELALANGPIKLQSEYIRANFDGTSYSRDMSSWYASLNWLVTGETFADAYKDGAFGRIRPKNNFNFGGEGWGALQVGIRFSNFDGGDFVTTNAAGTGKLTATTKTNGADAWTLGANWILNPNVRLIANYVHTSFDTPITYLANTFDKEDALTMRAQFDF
ncbi:porin P precursor [mine drainage metagenome]|uniref:Porin P n=1 Tax=mine drainage metagenome TaxID=410659 RepID=A0A1J5TNH7_9ZZZZ